MDEKREEAQPGSAAGHESQDDHRMLSVAENVAGRVHVLGGSVHFEGEGQIPPSSDKCLNEVISNACSKIEREIESESNEPRDLRREFWEGQLEKERTLIQTPEGLDIFRREIDNFISDAGKLTLSRSLSSESRVKLHAEFMNRIVLDSAENRAEEFMHASEMAFFGRAGPVLFLSSVLPKEVTILRDKKRVRFGQNEYRLMSRLEHFEKCMVRVENRGDKMAIRDFFVGQRRLKTKSSWSPAYVYSESALQLEYIRKLFARDPGFGVTFDFSISLDVYNAHMIELEFVEDEKTLPCDLVKTSF